MYVFFPKGKSPGFYLRCTIVSQTDENPEQILRKIDINHGLIHSSAHNTNRPRPQKAYTQTPTHLTTQCAAVTTQWRVMMAPPQRCTPRNRRLTTQGQSPRTPCGCWSRRPEPPVPLPQSEGKMGSFRRTQWRPVSVWTLTKTLVSGLEVEFLLLL